MRTVVSLLAAAGLTAGAHGQGYQIATGDGDFVILDPGPDGNVTLDLAVMVGWFGEGGLGPRSFLGSISVSDSLGGSTLAPIPPDGSAPAGTGAAGPEFSDGPTSGMGSTTTQLNNVDWFRGGVLDPTGTNPPPAHGVDELVHAGAVQLTITGPLVLRDVIIDFTSTSANIESWNYVPFAFSWFVGNSGPSQTATFRMVIRVLPAPGAVAVLGLGGLFAARRRR